MDYSTKLLERSGSLKGLDESLRDVRNLQRQDRREEAYDLLDGVYMHFGEPALEPIQDIAPEFYADVTETVEFWRPFLAPLQIVRREAQALESIAQQISRKPGIDVSETGQTYDLVLFNRGLCNIPQELYQFPQLYALHLGGNQLTTLQGISNLPELLHLELSGNKLTSLEGMPNLPKLHTLNLFVNQLTSLEEMPNLPKLQVLFLSGNQLTSPQGLPNLPQLQHLAIECNKLTNLQGMPDLPQLQRLDLYGNRLASLEGMPNLPQLQKLHLRKNPALQDPKRIKELRRRGVEVTR